MLFKFLHGDPSRISMDITPFHEGHCYITHDGYMYVDINVGTEEAPDNQRIKLNAKNAETLAGASLAAILNYDDLEIPTSRAVLDALDECRSEDIYATLLAAHWTNRRQTLLIEEIKANQNGLVSMPHTVTSEQLEAIYKAGIYISAQTNGAITFTVSGHVPEIDIPIVIILLG